MCVHACEGAFLACVCIVCVHVCVLCVCACVRMHVGVHCLHVLVCKNGSCFIDGIHSITLQFSLYPELSENLKLILATTNRSWFGYGT